MSGFQTKSGELYAEDIALSDIAAQFGTPAYVYSRAALTEAFQRFDAGFSGIDHLVCYAVKANPNLAILNLFARLGAGFDIVSGGELARVLADEIRKQGRSPRLYVQVNTGEEPQKAGVAPLEADAFLDRVRGELGLPVEGLMCIPPADEPPGPHFALLARIAARNGLEKLSMGMSGDFETAIAFGATSVRVGSALFGHRAAPAA